LSGIDPSDLSDLCQQLLTACISSLETIPVLVPTYGGAPARAFVSPGSPALDCCEQLAIYVSSIGDSPITGPVPSAPKAKINNVTLVAITSRCIPMPDDRGNPPTAEAQSAAADQIHLDMWALWNHLFNMLREGLLFNQCGHVEFVGITPLIPSGGCGGSQLVIRVSLDGYQESFST
jgi:hypothetical protein